jgi:hypothetical protein
MHTNSNYIAYKLNKILSNTLFSFDKDINSYYDYLGGLEYSIDFLFRTYFKFKLFNFLLLSNLGIDFVYNLDIIEENIIEEAEQGSLIEEFELDFEIKKQEELQDLELLEKMKKLLPLEDFKEFEIFEEIEKCVEENELEKSVLFKASTEEYVDIKELNGFDEHIDNIFFFSVEEDYFLIDEVVDKILYDGVQSFIYLEETYGVEEFMNIGDIYEFDILEKIENFKVLCISDLV